MRKAVRHFEMRVCLQDSFQFVVQDVRYNLEAVGVVLDVVGSGDMPERMSAEAGTVRDKGSCEFIQTSGNTA